MNNTLYYIKPINNDFPEAIKKGLIKALYLIQKKGYSNIKFVLTGIGHIDNPPNFISEAFDKIFNGKGDYYANLLRKNRVISIPQFPTEEQTTGINLLLSNNNPSFTDENTVVLLLWADEDSLKKIQSTLFFTQIDLIAIVFNDEPNLNELLSASKAKVVPENLIDQNVVPYTNTFQQPVSDVLNRLKGINVTSGASHTPTRELMKSVIDELKRGRMVVSYVDFLGFLVNEVNFPLKESVDLLNWKRTYFGR
jgi:hypothetical protein